MSQYERPGPTAGMRHLALNVNDLAGSVDFYTRLLGMTIEWQPDEDNYYLTSGNDNLALHRADNDVGESGVQSLDHLGFIIDKSDDVNRWFDFLQQEKVEMLTQVKNHRDGARSFYCKDPDGNAVQIIYHPPLSLGE
ncbi:MAG: VOC family protein [Gammaproteobacteria bacterium]|nr:VOC family protein [Gammaproteobacteria bacterium]